MRRCAPGVVLGKLVAAGAADTLEARTPRGSARTAGRSAAACRGARSWSASGAPRRCDSAGGTCSARSARARSSPPVHACAAAGEHSRGNAELG